MLLLYCTTRSIDCIFLPVPITGRTMEPATALLSLCLVCWVCLVLFCYRKVAGYRTHVSELSRMGVRTSIPFRGQITWNLTNLSAKRDCSPRKVNPFRTAVPFWGQTSQISSSFVPKRDCGSKRVKVADVVQIIYRSIMI